MVKCEYVELVRRKLRSTEFFDPHYGEVFSAILRLPSVTLQSVHEFLTKLGIAAPLGTQWGAVLSDLVDKGAALSDRAVLARAVEIRRRFFARWRRGLLERMGKAAENGDDPSEATASFQREAAGIDREEGRDGIAGEFSAASQNYYELMTDDSPEPEPILGDLLYPASLAEIVAVEGTGKGWIQSQQLVQLTQGKDFFGIQSRRIRCGLLSLEDPRRVLKKRLQRIALATQADEELLRENLHVICPPRLNSIFDLLQPTHQAVLRDWIRDLGLQFVAIDTLADAHSGDERDLRPVIQAVLPICRETEAVIQFAHHEPKTITTGRSRSEENLSHRSRGDTRLPAKVRFAMHLQKKHGLVLLSFSKTNEGRRPDPIWLKQEDSGVFVVTEAPKNRIEESRARQEEMVELVEAAGENGLLMGDVAHRLGVTTTTIRRWAEAQGDRVALDGHGRNRRMRTTTLDNT